MNVTAHWPIKDFDLHMQSRLTRNTWDQTYPSKVFRKCMRLYLHEIQFFAFSLRPTLTYELHGKWQRWSTSLFNEYIHTNVKAELWSVLKILCLPAKAISTIYICTHNAYIPQLHIHYHCNIHFFCPWPKDHSTGEGLYRAKVNHRPVKWACALKGTKCPWTWHFIHEDLGGGKLLDLRNSFKTLPAGNVPYREIFTKILTRVQEMTLF